KRTLPFFDRAILGDLRLGKNVLVVAHGNSNRSIVMQLDALSREQVLELNLDTGVPLVYDIAADGTVGYKQIRKGPAAKKPKAIASRSCAIAKPGTNTISKSCSRPASRSPAARSSRCATGRPPSPTHLPRCGPASSGWWARKSRNTRSRTHVTTSRGA